MRQLPSSRVLETTSIEPSLSANVHRTDFFPVNFGSATRHEGGSLTNLATLNFMKGDHRPGSFPLLRSEPPLCSRHDLNSTKAALTGRMQFCFICRQFASFSFLDLWVYFPSFILHLYATCLICRQFALHLHAYFFFFFFFFF